MWTISEVKQTGKEAFKKNYWGCVLVSLVLGIIFGGSGFSGYSSGVKSAVNSMEQAGLSAEEILGVMAVIASIAAVFNTIWILAKIFALNPLEVGCWTYLKENITGDVSFDRLKAGFEDYMRIVVAMVLRNLFLGLWFALFFFPGVVKSYSYMLVPYLLADDPSLTGTAAITKSRQMMNGHKWNAFLMDLSFIGWVLLSIITCGIVGILYEEPYRNSSKAALYLKLKELETPSVNENVTF